MSKETGQRDTAKAAANGDGNMTDTTTSAVERLAKDTEITSSMINMGERIHWGSETALMDQCAATLRALAAERDRLRDALAPFAELSDIKLCGEWRDDESIRSTDLAWLVKFKMIRDARAALEESKLASWIYSDISLKLA